MEAPNHLTGCNVHCAMLVQNRKRDGVYHDPEVMLSKHRPVHQLYILHHYWNDIQQQAMIAKIPAPSFLCPISPLYVKPHPPPPLQPEYTVETKALWLGCRVAYTYTWRGVVEGCIRVRFHPGPGTEFLE
jgi:hypothetical protein